MTSHDPAALGHLLPVWSVVPFVGLLLSIALFPLFAPGFWGRHFGKISFLFGLPVGAYFLVTAPQELLHTTIEYISFLVLLASLFTISGGVLVRGTIRGTPAVNCAFLATGAVLANLVGTTGAAMILIRPLLRANAYRKRAAHVVIFFIFVVANIGGSLTPIGDPPLFLGYLKEVPFFWPLQHLWMLWLAACVLVILIFYVVDRRAYAFEALMNGDASAPASPLAPEAAADAPEAAADAPAVAGDTPGNVRFAIEGNINLFLLLAVIGAVFLPTPYRETVMAAMAVASVWLTPARVRAENEFTYHPIQEVAILFAGIFATMIPALLILKARGGELGVTDPSHFFWVTGGLSSFLDNAPTYLTFMSLGQGLGGAHLVAGVSTPILVAISAGAVFMGANTYIGNAPNFMVKAIAEEAGVRMPSFFGYMAWSCGTLLPIFALLTLVFF